MLLNRSRDIVRLQVACRPSRPNHVLVCAVDIDTATTPCAASRAFCIDNERTIDDPAAAEHVDLDTRGMLWHDMAHPEARADRDVFPILRGIRDEDQGSLHSVAEAKCSPRLSCRSREVEEQGVGAVRGDIERDGDIIVGIGRRAQAGVCGSRESGLRC